MTDSSVPQATKPPRPVLLTFTQSVLFLQAVAAFCALLATWGLQRVGIAEVSAGAMWGAGAAFILALVWAASRQRERWGRWVGWFLQLPMIVAGLVVPAIAVIGVVFLAIWITGVRLGTRLDAERAERDLAAAQEAQK